MPKRLQRLRTAGARLPAGVVIVDRTTKWGNPHKLPAGMHITQAARAKVVRRFELDLLAGALDVTVDDVTRELRGKDLACWCQLDHACHADVLLRIANAEASHG